MRPRRRRILSRRRAAALATVALTAALCGCAGSRPVEPPPRGPISVSPDGLGDYATLEQAAREAPAGATILLDPGVYRLAAPLDVYRSLELVGAGRAKTIVECGSGGHVLGFSGNGWFRARGIGFRHLALGPESDPSDVALFRGGSVQLEECGFDGATRGAEAPSLSTVIGQASTRGGAGVRLLNGARAVLWHCSARDDRLAGVVVEPHASLRLLHTSLVDNGLRGVYVLPGRRGPERAEELTAFLGPTMDELMRVSQVPGAVVVVVKNGRVLLSRGYGYADVARRLPVDPERTLFRIASISKLFTATAAMQLVERGTLKLARPAQDYLGPVRLPRTFKRPITVADLLTHSSGFDERTVGMASRGWGSAPPLERYLVTGMPTRVVPAGFVYSYNNFDMALAGEIVQRLAGEPFEEYVQHAILDPLGMSRTTFRPAGDLAASVAASYGWADQRFVRRAGDANSVFNAQSAGQLYSTGADMVRFMLCQLQGGRLGTARILSAGSVRLMQGRRFGNAPQLPGSGYGFYERSVNNRRLIEHAGDWGGYSSLLFLLPEDDLGVFVATNGGRADFREELVDRFMYHYYPDLDRLYGVRAPSSLASGLRQFAGTYRTLRLAHRTLDKWLSFDSRKDLVVGVERGGAITVHDTLYVQIEPLLFHEQYGETYAAFQRDHEGRVRYLFRGTTTYRRLHWYETYVNQRRLVILFAFVLGITFLAWLLTPLIGELQRRFPWTQKLTWRRPFGYVEPRPARAARAIAGIVALVDLGFLGGAALLITAPHLEYGPTTGVKLLLVIPLVATAITAGLPVLAGVAWARRYWGVFGRLSFTFVTLIAALFVWFLTYWNLLGFKY